MENILAQAKKVAEEAEVFFVSARETPVHFEANRLKNIQSKQSTTLALRIVKEGKIGHATTTDLGSGWDLIDMAVETARFDKTTRLNQPE